MKIKNSFKSRWDGVAYLQKRGWVISSEGPGEVRMVNPQMPGRFNIVRQDDNNHNVWRIVA